MSTPTETPAPGPVASPGRRRLLLALAAGALVAVLVVVAVLLGGDDDDDRKPTSGASSTSSAPTDTAVPPPLPTPEPTGPTEDADELPAPLPEAALDATVDAGNGVAASLPSIRGIQGSATGPGNIAGPAVQVTVRISNGSAAAISLGGVAVNMYYSDERTPASPLDDPSQRPFAGMLDPGQSAEGVYVFSVPAEARDMVTVEVGYQAGAPLVLFTGPVR
ncbi:hypothetical protein DQ237_15585 [Blastococcus sp. TF02-8]|uniref:hypothetical protein n=1 Tax=Blastococcus sp. TF02-8 TaxID=2250574 RepID=UPI000DE945C2|nr:hypothetical protein [Blastococcus sp. TF02-8]RBY95119.1 hypothetical protein DQ237_15585 [Blastococcus sp. TF02-8]